MKELIELNSQEIIAVSGGNGFIPLISQFATERGAGLVYGVAAVYTVMVLTIRELLSTAKIDNLNSLGSTLLGKPHLAALELITTCTAAGISGFVFGEAAYRHNQIETKK